MTKDKQGVNIFDMRRDMRDVCRQVAMLVISSSLLLAEIALTGRPDKAKDEHFSASSRHLHRPIARLGFQDSIPAAQSRDLKACILRMLQELEHS